jgi:hypothetical protein
MPRYGRQKRFYLSRGVDECVIARAKFVGSDNAAGAAITTAAIVVDAANDDIEFSINGSGEGMNTYTGAAGAAGAIRISDANANTPQEVVNIINGIGAGMPAPGASGYNRRWRGALGDFPPGLALVSGELLNQASDSALVGEHDATGVTVLHDTSDVAAEYLWVGCGTEHRLLKGGDLVYPDYFEDLPGVSAITGNASNAPDRTARTRKREDAGIYVPAYRVVIDMIRVTATWNTDAKTVAVFAESDTTLATPLYTEVLATEDDTELTGRQDTMKIVGPPGEALFVRVVGSTDQITAGRLFVSGYLEYGVDYT